MLFQDACHLLLQPTISALQLSIADSKLYEFCTAYKALYGKEKCTPNMHMHMHLCKSIQNYGPVTSFWCFPFERFNGILGSFQKNWISPELQMAKKFLTYQYLLTMDITDKLPQEIQDFWTLCKQMWWWLFNANACWWFWFVKIHSICLVSFIDAKEGLMHKLYRWYERVLQSDELKSLTTV